MTSLIERVAVELGISVDQASVAVAMSYEHVARGIYALNKEPSIGETADVLRLLAQKLRTRHLAAVEVLDATEDWA